ncbi:MAG: hypothetical protein V8T52_02270 [Ruminococcus sp.]
MPCISPSSSCCIRWILFRFRGMNQFRQTPIPLPMSSRSSSFPTMPEVTPPASI